MAFADQVSSPTLGGTMTDNGSSNVISDDLQISKDETKTINQGDEWILSGKVNDGESSTGNMTITGGGTLTLTGTENTFSGNWFVIDGSTLGLSGNGVTLGTGAVSLSGDSTLKTSGDISLSNTVTGSGTLSVESGSLTITSSVTLGKTIENNGALTIAEGGLLSFASCADLVHEGDLVYYDPKSDTTGNGYLKGTFQIVSAGGSADVGDEVIIEGKKRTVEVKADGSVWAQVNTRDQVEGGLFYISSGAIQYSDGGTHVNYDFTTGIVMYGGTLKMNGRLKETATEGIIVKGDAAISIIQGELNTLKSSSLHVADGATLTLQNHGNYDLGSSFSTVDKYVTLGNGVILGDVDPNNTVAGDDNGWNGNVLLSHLTIGGKEDNSGAYITSLNGLSKNSSWVKISNVSGYAYDVTDEYSPNITARLWLDGEDALTLTEGKADSTITFSGAIRDSFLQNSTPGNIVYSKDGIENQTFVFSGNIDSWKGNFKATGEGGSETVKFTGGANTIGASVENSGSSKMTVDIDNDNPIRMGGDITNSGLGELHVVMHGSGTKSMQGNIHATSLEVNGEGTVHLENEEKSYHIGTVTVNSGTFTIGYGLADVTLENLTICSGACLNATSCAITNGNITLSGGTLMLYYAFDESLRMNGSLNINQGSGLSLTIPIELLEGETPEPFVYTLATGVTSFNNETQSRDVEAWSCFDNISVCGSNWVAWNPSPESDAMTLHYDSEAQTLTLRYGVIPEPTTAMLSLLSLGAFAWHRRRN